MAKYTYTLRKWGSAMNNADKAHRKLLVASPALLNVCSK